MKYQAAISPSEPTTSPAAANEVHQQQGSLEYELNLLPVYKGAIQCKLSIGSPDDPLEHEADAMADTVMRMPENNFIQRQCSQCEEETEKVQRKPLTSFIQRKESSRNSVASEAISNMINASKGGGSTMDSNTQTFMQTRFGTDFSGIKIHTGGDSVQMNRELNAKAFTVGSDIYFNEGQYNPNSADGKHLLAHELTHTVQQTGSMQTISRRINVSSPRRLIPNPTGTGLVQTNRVTVLDYLNRLCPSGGISVSDGGIVDIPTSFCSGLSAGAGLPTPPQSGTPVGCDCICDLVRSPYTIQIAINDSAYPDTRFSRPRQAERGAGSGSRIRVPSPNTERLYGAVTTSGQFLDNDPWLILGHELCGHARLGSRGQAHLDNIGREHGRQPATVDIENQLRDEHGIARRGSFRTPFCGESFWHPVGTTAAPPPSSTVMSSSMSECADWRQEYNHLNHTSFSTSDTIPVTPGEILPP